MYPWSSLATDSLWLLFYTIWLLLTKKYALFPLPSKYLVYLSCPVISILEVYHDKWFAIPLIKFQEVTKKPSMQTCLLPSEAFPKHSSGWYRNSTWDSAFHPFVILGTWTPQNGAPGRAPMTLAEGRCESRPDSLRGCEMEGFLPET